MYMQGSLEQHQSYYLCWGREGQEMPSWASHDPSPQQVTSEDWDLEDDGSGETEVCVYKQKWGG